MSKLAERVGIVEQAMADFAAKTAVILAAIREDVAEIRLSNARTDRQLLAMQQQADKDRQQADQGRRDFNKRLAEITDAQGMMIENMVWPKLRRIGGQVFDGGVVEHQAIRVKRRLAGDPSQMMELDLMAVGGKAVLVCEAKSKVTVERVTDFLASLARLGEFFPEYAGHKLLPMIASICIDPGVLRFMTPRGVLALGFGGETMDLLNPEAVARAT